MISMCLREINCSINFSQIPNENIVIAENGTNNKKRCCVQTSNKEIKKTSSY